MNTYVIEVWTPCLMSKGYWKELETGSSRYLMSAMWEDYKKDKRKLRFVKIKQEVLDEWDCSEI